MAMAAPPRSLSTALSLPLPLPFEQAPTVATLISRVDPWIFYHMKSTFLSNPHYEHQLYGCLNIFLVSLFPLRRRYMTIPQPLIRRAIEEDLIEEDLSNISMGSTGALHEARDTPGTEVGKIYPDFAVVKVTPVPDVTREHYFVTVIELKREGQDEAGALERMIEYMDQIATHPSRPPLLRGFLVIGRIVTEVRATTAAGNTIFDVVPSFDMFAAGDPFTTALSSISSLHWNYSS